MHFCLLISTISDDLFAGVKAVAECLARVDSDNLRDKARVLLHELANVSELT